MRRTEEITPKQPKGNRTMYTHRGYRWQGTRYEYLTIGNGAAVLITRKSDNAECLLQGDDAETFLEEVSDAKSVNSDRQDNVIRVIDDLCAEYDDVMEERVPAFA